MKTINMKWILIGSMVIIGIALIFLINRYAHSSSPNSKSQPSDHQSTNAPLSHDVSLGFEQNDSSVSSIIDTGDMIVSGAQLVISYDPSLVTNVAIQPGTFFYQPNILQNNIDTTMGIISYTLAMAPNGLPAKGAGYLATITYDRVAGTQAPISFSYLPTTEITVQGINQSVLKKTTNITIPYSSP